jgi:hypothetical protein
VTLERSFWKKHSTVEAEYMASAAASKEALWHHKLRRDLRLPTEGPTQVWGDNQGSLVLVKDAVQYARARTKHVDVRHHAVRERVAQK